MTNVAVSRAVEKRQEKFDRMPIGGTVPRSDSVWRGGQPAIPPPSKIGRARPGQGKAEAGAFLGFTGGKDEPYVRSPTRVMF